MDTETWDCWREVPDREHLTRVGKYHLRSYHSTYLDSMRPFVPGHPPIGAPEQASVFGSSRAPRGQSQNPSLIQLSGMTLTFSPYPVAHSSERAPPKQRQAATTTACTLIMVDTRWRRETTTRPTTVLSVDRGDHFSLQSLNYLQDDLDKIPCITYSLSYVRT